MVDIHCHIVPGVDDGAWDLEAALAMAHMAWDSGVECIIATPHFMGTPEELEKLPRILRQLERLQHRLSQERSELTLLPGAEVLCRPETLEMARQGLLPTLGSSRYVLTEFYFDASWEFMDGTMEGLRRYGYRPVVAHPERYEAIQREPDRAGSWYRRGVVMQVNKGSVLGAFGTRAEDTALKLMNRGLIHIIASDAHSPRRRTPELESVRRWAVENLGREYTGLLLEENPERLARGQRVRGYTG